MSISEQDAKFIARRERYVSNWPWTAALTAIGLLFCATWLWMVSPYFINPIHVSKAVQTETLPDSVAEIMAVMLPILVLLYFALGIIIILLGTLAIRNEKRLLRLLRGLEKEKKEP